MILWEYLLVALPSFEAPTATPETSAAARALNDEGARGWEAVGMTLLADGTVAVLFKRPLEPPGGQAPSDHRPPIPQSGNLR